MSSPAAQFVYVPNLVGGQMLRLPVEQAEAEGHSFTQQPIASPSLSSRYTRSSSPTPSVESPTAMTQRERKPWTTTGPHQSNQKAGTDVTPSFLQTGGADLRVKTPKH
ncbi:hypothetical protein A1F94_011463 [Pyrenophora tritici-repentis]|nr:hypothetical protein A1F94_011463 [Pyrenophora tritici-repentis]